MSKARSPNRDKAFEIYKEKNGNITPREIAQLLGESASNISSWKNKDRWSEKVTVNSSNKKGAPKGNLNSLKHGHYCDPTKHIEESFLKKYLPTVTKNIIKGTVEAGCTPLDIIWAEIQIQNAAIINSQRIMEVKNKREMIKELKKTKVQKELKKDAETGKDVLIEVYREEEFEFQFAWDRQATFLNSQSRAMSELRSLIKQYDDMLHKNWDLATEEQKFKIEKLKLEVASIEQEYKNNELAKNKNINPYAGLTTEELKKLINDG